MRKYVFKLIDVLIKNRVFYAAWRLKHILELSNALRIFLCLTSIIKSLADESAITASVTITIMDQTITWQMRTRKQPAKPPKKHPGIDTQAVVKQTCKRYITFVCTLVFNLVRQTSGPAFLHSESGHRQNNWVELWKLWSLILSIKN